MRAIYGMAGKVNYKQLKKDIRSDMKKLQKRKKELIKKGTFTAERKTYYNERMREYKKLLR